MNYNWAIPFFTCTPPPPPPLMTIYTYIHIKIIDATDMHVSCMYSNGEMSLLETLLTHQTY